MLTKLKKDVQQMLTSQANAAHKIGLTPNRVSAIGFILALASATTYALTPNQPSWLLLLAVAFFLASGFCDALDGIIARKFQQTTMFGGFLDSLLDRFSDGAVYAGIIIGGLAHPLWGLAALIGSMLVSYSRARAEAVNIKMESVGLAERAERMIILAAATLIEFLVPNMGILNYGIILLAALSNLTVIQRVVHVYRKLKKKTV